MRQLDPRQLPQLYPQWDRIFRGGENLAAHTNWPSIQLMRRVRALNLRRAFIRHSVPGNPAGIFRSMRELCRSCFLVVRSTPPALTLRIVAKSSISLPCLSAQYTNTGIARGRRCDRRRSWTAGLERGAMDPLFGQELVSEFGSPSFARRSSQVSSGTLLSGCSGCSAEQYLFPRTVPIG